MTSLEHGGEPRPYSLFVNGREHRVDRSHIAVFEIWALFGLDPNMELVLEQSGEEPDKLLTPDDIVKLDVAMPVEIFSRPQTSFG